MLSSGTFASLPSPRHLRDFVAIVTAAISGALFVTLPFAAAVVAVTCVCDPTTQQFDQNACRSRNRSAGA
jgi:hypothetical protein